jgi:hypothetical protein
MPLATNFLQRSLRLPVARAPRRCSSFVSSQPLADARPFASPIIRSTRETDGTLDFTGVWLLRLWGFGSGVRVIQPSSSLWECGNPASFAGFPSAGGTVEKSGVGLFHGFPRASFPQRTCSE